MANNPLGTLCINATNEADMLAFCKDYANQDKLGDISSAKEYVGVFMAYFKNMPWNHSYLLNLAHVDEMSYLSPTSIEIDFCVPWLDDIQEWVERLLQNHPLLTAKGVSRDCYGGISWDFEYVYNETTGKREFHVTESELVYSDAYDSYKEIKQEEQFRIGVKDDNSCVIIGSVGEDLNVAIPDTIEGYKVVGIGRCAFDGSSIQSVVIPEGVTCIDKKAFRNCTNLTTLVLPDSLKEIVYYAFENCIGLTKVILPNSLEKIDKGSFLGCTGLKDIKIPDGTIFDGNPFIGCNNLPGYLNVQKTKTSEGQDVTECLWIGNIEMCVDVVIPDGVTFVRCFSFNGCYNLKRVVIPDSVTVIGCCAFKDCTKLETVDMSFGLKEIDKEAFWGCVNLKNIVVPDSVNCIEQRLFEGCTNLTNVSLPASLLSINSYAFAKCVNLKSIHLPDNLRIIGEAAFKGCVGLTEIDFPERLTHLCQSVFSGCEGLSNVFIPEVLTHIGDFAFDGCSSLSDVVMPNGNVEIGHSAFDRCPKLTNTDLPIGNESDEIPDSTFLVTLFQD